MADFTSRVSVKLTRGDTSQLLARVRQGLLVATQQVCQGIFDRSQELVAVDKGELKGSGHVVEPVDDGQSVTGRVEYTADHSYYVEFGTGRRGAASPGASDQVSYSQTWPGMASQPYIRPAADEARDGIKGTYAEALSTAISS
jgi:hypothetical protein